MARLRAELKRRKHAGKRQQRHIDKKRPTLMDAWAENVVVEKY